MPVTSRRVNEAVNLPEVVRLAMEEFDGDKDKAIRALTLRTRDAEVNDAFRALGIQQAVRSYIGRERHGGSEAPSTPFAPRARFSGDSTELIQARADARIVKKLLWDRMTLYGGTITMGDATRKEIHKSGQAFGAQERGNGNMRRLSEDCVKRMTHADKPLKDQLTDAKFTELARTHEVIPS